MPKYELDEDACFRVLEQVYPGITEFIHQNRFATPEELERWLVTNGYKTNSEKKMIVAIDRK